MKQKIPWQKQAELKKRYGSRDLPNLSELNNIINRIHIGKVNIDFQTKRAKALFAMYYLTACRCSEIILTTKLRKQKLKVSIEYDVDGSKRIIYAVDGNKKPVIERWTEEHEYLGTMKCDMKIKEFSGISFLELRTENRKNKNRQTKLLPIPIEKESEIVKHLLHYTDGLTEDQALFNFSTRRAAQIINQTTGFNVHFIRHIRATHLITNYDFNEQMLIRFMGWTDSRPAKSYLELRTSDLAKEFTKNG